MEDLNDANIEKGYESIGEEEIKLPSNKLNNKYLSKIDLKYIILFAFFISASTYWDLVDKEDMSFVYFCELLFCI